MRWAGPAPPLAPIDWYTRGPKPNPHQRASWSHADVIRPGIGCGHAPEQPRSGTASDRPNEKRPSLMSRQRAAFSQVGSKKKRLQRGAGGQ